MLLLEMDFSFCRLAARLSLCAAFLFTVSIQPAAADQVCGRDRTVPCVKAQLSLDVGKVSAGSESWMTASELAKAGLFEEAESLILRSQTSLNSLAIENLAAMIAAQETVDHAGASAVSKIELFLSEHPLLGARLNEQERESFKSNAYRGLAFFLLNQIGEGGDGNDVKFHEMAGLTLFKPDATWRAVINAWRTEIEKLPEPTRSYHREFLAGRLADAGNVDAARAELKKITDTKAHSVSLALLHLKLKDYDTAIAASANDGNKTVYYRAMVAKAGHLKDTGKNQDAIGILDQAGEEIRMQKTMIGKWEEGIALIQAYETMGQNGSASALADFIVGNIEASPMKALSLYRIPQAYREAGEIEKAKASMASIIGKPRACTIVGDEVNAKIALELYRLGMLKEFNEVSKGICEPSALYDLAMTLYAEQFERGGAPVTAEKMEEILPPERLAGAFGSMASFHYLRKEREAGDRFLSMAAEKAPLAASVDIVCQIATTAFFAGRQDIVKNLEGAAVDVASRSVPYKEPRPRDFLSRFMFPAEPPVAMEDHRLRQLARAAACYNSIDITARRQAGR